MTYYAVTFVLGKPNPDAAHVRHEEWVEAASPESAMRIALVSVVHDVYEWSFAEIYANVGTQRTVITASLNEDLTPAFESRWRALNMERDRYITASIQPLNQEQLAELYADVW